MNKRIICFLSMILCVGILTSCTSEYDTLVENQCKLTGNTEIRSVDESYVLPVGDTVIYIPEYVNRVFYEYQCIDNQKYWSQNQYVIDSVSQETN